MIRRPPQPTLTYTLFPYPTLFRSLGNCAALSIFGRRSSRGTISLTQTLPALLEPLLDAGPISLETTASFHALGGCWTFEHLGAELAQAEKPRREDIFGILANDAVEDRWYACDLRGLAEAGISEPNRTPTPNTGVGFVQVTERATRKKR